MYTIEIIYHDGFACLQSNDTLESCLGYAKALLAGTALRVEVRRAHDRKLLWEKNA